MVEKILKCFENEGWSTESKTNETVIFQYIGNSKMRNCEQYFVCREDGIYYLRRGNECLFCNLGGFNLNLVGLYCLLSNQKHKAQSVIDSEQKAFASLTDLNVLLKKYNIESYVNFDCDLTKNDVFNVVCDRFPALNYALGSCYITVASAPIKTRLYADIFKYAIYKKKFDSEVLPIIDKSMLSDQLILRLFCIFSKSTDVNLKTKDE